MEQHESMGKGIPADVTDAHKMFRFARSKPDWCTELGKAFRAVPEINLWEGGCQKNFYVGWRYFS